MTLTVKNCLGHDFEHTCGRLAQQVAASYQPDLLIGIRSGGAVVADALLKTGLLTVDYVELVAQRRATRYKKAFRLEWILQFVPRWLCNLLRIWEMQRAIAGFDRQQLPPRDVLVSAPDEGLITGARRVLIIDDAVDSGATLHAVCKHVRQLNPAAVIKTAALTVTFPEPVQTPDYYLYRDVLLRFPWSADAKRFS
jgi:hypoxanthine phosphoribosyltransferase